MTLGENRKHFIDLYNRESDSLFRFCLFRVSDREKALDLTQEAFTKLWQAMFRGEKIENPRALLYKIARNLIIDWYRRKKSLSLESLFGNDDGKDFDAPDEKAHVEIEVEAGAKQALLLLQNLDPEYREVIYFRYVEDLNPKDIAEILNLNANIVSIRLTRGMEELRKLMGIEKNNE